MILFAFLSLSVNSYLGGSKQEPYWDIFMEQKTERDLNSSSARLTGFESAVNQVGITTEEFAIRILGLLDQFHILMKQIRINLMR